VTARAATLFDPALRFRLLKTDHFRIYFHQHEDRLAYRLALIAEETWVKLQRPLGTRPPTLTHVVLADQTELPNAYATPFPYDTIVIYPTWPSGSEFNVDDWLRLVFTHEFTHIVHLDRSESWARAVRAVFGRTPIAFPNIFLPTWQVEGLATYTESAITGEGRLHAGDFRVIVDEAARQRSLQPLDRVNGGLTDWPGGQAPYAYGAAFHQYLADRFGVRTLGELAEATARRVPYTSSPVFSRIYGQSLGSLWRDFEDALVATAAPAGSKFPVTRLTHNGFVAAAPRFDRTFDTCLPAILYASRTPHLFPSLNRVPLSGGPEQRINSRYFGTTTAVGTRAVYFDQLEVRRAVGLYGDLYERSRDSGRVRRLTRDGRLHDPDLSPDEMTLAAVQENTSRRDLVLVHLSPRISIQLLAGSDDVQFNAPRWSPDGRSLAVERHRLGQNPEIVLVDVSSRVMRVVAARTDARIVMPAWRPDGRAIVAAVATGDEPFNLFEFDVEAAAPPRQLTDLAGGVTWPELSPDGKTIVFVGYTTDGFDLFSMPYPAEDRQGPPGSRVSQAPHTSAQAGPAQAEPDPALESSTYSPVRTLMPTSWSPILESDGDQVRIGAATGGVDVLGYHAYALSATWLVSAPDGAISPDRSIPDWTVSYAYDRWVPTFFATASGRTAFFAGPPNPDGTPSAVTRREQQIEAGIAVPFVRTRWSHTAVATFLRSVDDYMLIGRTATRDRAAIRAAWRTNTAHTFGYSISPERGITIGATSEFVRQALGASADASTFTGDLRAYLPVPAAHHVAALRIAGGTSTGDPSASRTFLLGGQGPDGNVIDFGSSAASLLRGFPANTFAGNHIALVNVEYRFPISRQQRGVGTWPLFLHTVHADVFGDAGHTWTEHFDMADLKTSFGAELSANIVAGFYFPFTATIGVARGHDGSGTVPDRTMVYGRIGRSF
jgi:hypothetical protein